MADPLLDEQKIVSVLKTEPANSNEAVRALQSGVTMALVDAYDRKVDRESFICLMSAVLQMYGNLSVFHTLNSIVALHDSGALDRNKFDDAFTALMAKVRKDHSSVLAMMELIQQCPLSKDTVH